MGIAEKLRNDDLAARRAIAVRRMVWSAVGLVFFLFILFYYLLPLWRGAPQP